MAFSDSEVYTNNTCSKTCLKSYETLKNQYDDLSVEFNKSEFNLITYKRGLAYVEEQLVFYKKNEVIFCQQITVLNRDLSYRDSEIKGHKSKVDKHKKEKESTQLKLNNFDQASRSLDKLIESQITDKSRKGVGFESYNVVPPLPTGLFLPLKIDLSYSGLEEFQQLEFESYRPKSCNIESKNASENIPNELKESTDVKESSDISLLKKVGGHPQQVQENQGYVDNGCSRHMTGNMSYLSDFKEFNEGYDSAKVKIVNEDVQMRALVYGKKIIVTEASIRRDLQLQDAEEKVGEGSEVPTDTKHTPIVTQPSFSQPQKKQKSRRIQRKETKGRMNEEESFGVNDLDGNEVIMDATAGEEVEHSTKVAEIEVSIVDPVTTAGEVVTTAEDVEVTTAATTPQISKDELTLAHTLIEIKATKPKARWAKDKGIVIMVEPEKPLKKKDQIAFDEKVARKLKAQMKAEMEEKERIQGRKMNPT
nr:hypothetical protein [Tanacetum cinerariifolium]